MPKKENSNAKIAVVCNSAANFVHLKEAFAKRNDLKNYKLFYCQDQAAANRHAGYCDFAILYFPKGDDSRMTDTARAAYQQLEQHNVMIRLAFFQIVNYTE